MCDPVSLGIMLGTKAAETYFSKKAKDAVDDRRKGIISDTDRFLKKTTGEARKDYAKSFDAATPEAMQARQAQETLDRTASYQGALKDPQAIVSEGGSDAAKKAFSTALAASLAEQKRRAGLRGAAESYGGAAGGRNIVMRRAGQGIDQKSNFAGGRARVAELELADAAHAGDKYANLAGLVSAIGTVAGAAYGGMGKTPIPVKDAAAPIYAAGPAGASPASFDIYSQNPFR